MEAELIPGLPDDVALQCLIRLPLCFFRIAQRVCKRWKHEISSYSFYRLRKAADVIRPFAALVISNPDFPTDKRVALYDATTRVWTRLPAITNWSRRCHVVAVGHELVVIGRRRLSTNAVQVHNLLTGVWRLGARMPGPRRAFFSCAAAAKSPVVFVAGGQDEQGQALRSALAYNVETDTWVPLPDMAHPRRKCRGIFVGGLFRVFSGHRRFEAFDATAGEWTTRCTVIHRRTAVAAAEEERVYACDSRGKMYVHSVRDVTRQLLFFRRNLIEFTEHVAAWGDRVMVIERNRRGLKAYILEERLRRVELPMAYILERLRNVASPMKVCGNVESLCCAYF